MLQKINLKTINTQFRSPLNIIGSILFTVIVSSFTYVTSNFIKKLYVKLKLKVICQCVSVTIWVPSFNYTQSLILSDLCYWNTSSVSWVTSYLSCQNQIKNSEKEKINLKTINRQFGSPLNIIQSILFTVCLFSFLFLE